MDLARSAYPLLAPVLALFLAACGASMPSGERDDRDDERATVSAASGATGTAANGSATPSGSAAMVEPACPATFAGARALAIDCEGAGRSACSYPEGACGCEIHYRCSGVTPEPDEPNVWRAWTCRETPPAFLPNGCPGREPADGDPCDGRARFCTYGDCAFTPYRCVDGRWQRGMPSAPPSAPD